MAKSSASADLGETAPPASLSPVIWAVAIASFGAFAFGYHCGVVNGPLNAIAADLGFAGNAALQGTVSICFLNLDLHTLHAIKTPPLLLRHARSLWQSRTGSRLENLPGPEDNAHANSIVTFYSGEDWHAGTGGSCKRLTSGQHGLADPLGRKTALLLSAWRPSVGAMSAIRAQLHLSPKAWLHAQVVSSLLAGAAVGSLAGSGLADSLGRKTALLLDAVPLLVGALVSATANSLTAMVVGRVLCGVGIGLASALVPLYISEVWHFVDVLSLPVCQSRHLIPAHDASHAG